MKIHTLDTGFFKLDGGAMFGVVPKSIWNKLNPADNNNMCTWAMRCLLVEDGKKLILIDTGIGNKQDERFLSYYYLHGEATLEKSIRQAGYGLDEVTDVVLTHLHFDHCGGATYRLIDSGRIVPTFKNAIYWSDEKHWAWATHPNAREKASFLTDNILPIQESGQLKFMTRDQSPFGHLSFIAVNGHTEGQLIPHIYMKGKTLVFAADLIPSLAHLPIPYTMSYDVRPLDSMEEKQLCLKRGLEQNHLIIFQHDPVYECCTLQQTERGIRHGAFGRLLDFL